MNYEEIQSALYYYKASVDRVVDGDTVDLLVDMGFMHSQKMRVRLARINTPELNRREEREAGLAAKQRLEELISGEQVVIRTNKDKTGKFGRYIADIYICEHTGELICVNDVLLKEGHAELYQG